MGRLLFGFLPFVFFRIWLRLAVVAGAVILTAVILRAVGIAPTAGVTFQGPVSQAVFLILLAAMAAAVAATVAAPFLVPYDLLIPWALHREAGTPPERNPQQQAALEKIRSASKELPKGGSWALGVRIVYTDKGQIVWAPTQVIYGALLTFLIMLLAGSILGGDDTPAWELLSGQYTRPLWLIGGAAGLVGGSIGRNHQEALVMGFCSCAFALAAAVWSSDMLQPWLQSVIPGILHALFWTLIAGRLILPRLRRLGRMAHYALVGIIAPTLVAGGIFCLAQRHTAACERNLYQGKITVSWVWPTSSGRLLMAGQIEMYGSHWLWQRNKLGAIWAIERDGGKLHYLTSGRAVRTPLTWRNLGFMERLPRLDRMVVPQEPTELELLLGGGETLVSVDFSGRFEPVPVPPGEDPLDNVRRTAVQLGLEMNEQDAALIAKAMGGDRGPWTLHPYPRHAAVLIEGPYNPKDRKVVLFDLKNDRAVPIEEPLDSYDLLVDGPRGREIVFLQSEHESSRAVAFNPQKKTRTVLTGYQRNLKLSGATDEIVLVRLGGQSFYDRRYGVARLDPGAEFKELAWPEEEMRFSTITPRGRIHAWTDKSLHIIDPASGEERTLARPKEMEPNTLGLKGYIEDDPIVELKNELKRLDTQSGKLKTLVRISSYPQL